VVHYNWGDSEVVMIFYLIMGLSLVVEREFRGEQALIWGASAGRWYHKRRRRVMFIADASTHAGLLRFWLVAITSRRYAAKTRIQSYFARPCPKSRLSGYRTARGSERDKNSINLNGGGAILVE